MNELILALNAAGIRYLLVGGQAMRLTGMPRFSMDWDFFIPPRDGKNFATLNDLLRAEIDLPLVAVGSRGENFIQTYQTRWGILQFHLGLPGVPRFPQMISLLRNFIHGGIQFYKYAAPTALFSIAPILPAQSLSESLEMI